MKVIEHVPPPAPQPPSSYDLVGLSRDELMAIGHLAGYCSGLISANLYNQVSLALGRVESFNKASRARFPGVTATGFLA